VVDTIGIEQAGAAFDAVDFVTFIKQEFGEVGTVLSGNASDQCDFVHFFTQCFH